MSEREEEYTGWWLLSVLAAVVLGWWLAMRTMARQVANVVANAVLAEPGANSAFPGRKASLEERADDYLTVRELEEYLPLCGKSIRKEIKEGKLPSHRLRGKVTVKGSDALAWLSARKEG